MQPEKEVRPLAWHCGICSPVVSEVGGAGACGAPMWSWGERWRRVGQSRWEGSFPHGGGGGTVCHKGSWPRASGPALHFPGGRARRRVT